MLTYAILIIISFFSLFPIYWMFISSVKGSSEILGYGLFAKNPTFRNYIDAFTTVPLLRMLGNSAFIAVATTAMNLFAAVLFAYAFMRWDFKGKSFIYGLLSVTWLIPVQVIMVPNYLEIIHMGLNNTLIAMVLPNMFSVFANITMYQSFNSMPRALIDAARMDGSSELQILFNIVLPNMRSSVASLCIITMINAWNNYLWPSLIARTKEMMPITIGLKSFIGTDSYMWGASMAASAIATIPMLIVYIVMNRQIMSSFMKGGIK